jgi:hypothetical protein
LHRSRILLQRNILVRPHKARWREVPGFIVHAMGRSLLASRTVANGIVATVLAAGTVWPAQHVGRYNAARQGHDRVENSYMCHQAVEKLKNIFLCIT